MVVVSTLTNRGTFTSPKSKPDTGSSIGTRDSIPLGTTTNLWIPPHTQYLLPSTNAWIRHETCTARCAAISSRYASDADFE